MIELLLIYGGIGFGIVTITWIAGKCRKASLYDTLKPRLDTLDTYSHDLDQKKQKLDRQEEAVLLLAKQKATGFPWLADAYADFYHLEDLQAARTLETKSHPAYKAAESVLQAGARRKVAERKARLIEYQIKYYESLFPWLTDFKNEDVEDELIRVSIVPADDNDNEDPAQHWLTLEEYRRLPNSEKYELALDRYWTKKKTKWEIGRDYERYFGYRRFVTSTRLSDRARGFAKLIGVEVDDGLRLARYPCIKCHISKQTGEKIYHLPFDQQYDHTIIETGKGEYYLETVREAERRGFRRAFRYRGPKE